MYLIIFMILKIFRIRIKIEEYERTYYGLTLPSMLPKRTFNKRKRCPDSMYLVYLLSIYFLLYLKYSINYNYIVHLLIT